MLKIAGQALRLPYKLFRILRLSSPNQDQRHQRRNGVNDCAERERERVVEATPSAFLGVRRGERRYTLSLAIRTGAVWKLEQLEVSLVLGICDLVL